MIKLINNLQIEFCLHRYLSLSHVEIMFYSLIAFDKRVTLWLQRTLCVCVCCIACMCNCVMFIHKPHVQIMQHSHTHKAVTERVEAKTLLSHKRQSDYRFSDKSSKFDSFACTFVEVLYLHVIDGANFSSNINQEKIFCEFLFSRLWFNPWKIEKNKKLAKNVICTILYHEG